MLKRYLCGVALGTTLMLSGPIAAQDLYVRNQPFPDHYVMQGSSYVPVEAFLRAIEVPWSWSDGVLVLGDGDSPLLPPTTTAFRARHGEQTVDLIAVPRAGGLYVPVEDLAELAGYSVIANSQTGITDIVRSRLTTAEDAKIARDLESAKEAEERARREALAAKRAAAEAKRAAKEAEEAAEGAEVAAGEAPPASAEPAAEPAADEEEEGEPEPPPEANLVVLTTEANPNNYTGEVIFRAVIQNQGYANATEVRADFKAVGPDGRTWVQKTVYHGPLAPDQQWEIVERYSHRAGSAIPRGEYDVTVNPTFQTAAGDN